MKLDGFEILEELGHGGMAAVYRARQVSLDREVAIKVFEPRFAPTPEDLEQFRNEARVAARLKHPGLVQVYDAVFSGEVCCFVMELVSGYTVGAWGARKGRLDEKTILAVADCVADALDYAWKQHKVVHCDIKPDNLMVDIDGTVKILDLGLAKTAQTIKRREFDDQVYGTPQYISPEQAIGQTDLDCRTDIYALGASLYQLATGQTLFPGHSDAEAMDMQVRSKAPNPRALNPELSIGFCSLIEKMLAKDRDRRQKDWLEVRHDIEAVRLGIPLPSGNPLAGSSTVESGPAPAFTKETLHLRASVHPPKGLGAAAEAQSPAPARKVRVRPAIRLRTRNTSSSSLASDSARSASPSRPNPVLAVVLLVVAAAAAAAYYVITDHQRRTTAERALADARAAEAALPAEPVDDAAFNRVEELYRAAAKHPSTLAAANAGVESLANRRESVEAARRKKAVDELVASAESLASAGNYDLAVSKLLGYDGPGAAESETRRKMAAETIAERRRRREESARQREAAIQASREAAAKREAAYRRESEIESQILDMLESSGIGAAGDLADQKADAEPALFSPGSRCSWLRTFLRDAKNAQDDFDRTFPTDGSVVTLRLRNGSEVKGRITRFVRGSDELRLTSRLNDSETDFSRTISLRQLAPNEIASRLVTSNSAGARFVRIRTYVRFDLPRSPSFVEQQCRGFPSRIRALATAPAGKP